MRIAGVLLVCAARTDCNALRPGGEELVGPFRPLTDERLTWAVAQDAPELKRRLDAILDDWRAASRIEPVLNRWIPVRVEVGD